MKKLLIMVLILMSCYVVGCSASTMPNEAKMTNANESAKEEIKESEELDQQDQDKVKNEADETMNEKIKVAALNGPTGMGLVQLIENDAFDISLYQNPNDIIAKVINEEVDIACVPSNLSSILYNRTDGEIRLLGVNTLGVLYILENGESINSIEDLRGKEIVMSGKGSTPEFIINHILQAQGIDPKEDLSITFMGDHSDVNKSLVTNEGMIAVLPEPQVTVAMSNNENINIVSDVNELWWESEEKPLPMGVVVSTKSFVEDRSEELEYFIDTYKESVKFVNEEKEAAAELIAQHGILPSKAVAEKAIPKSNIVLIEGEEAKEILENFLIIIGEEDMASVGGKLPDEEFYFER